MGQELPARPHHRRRHHERLNGTGYPNRLRAEEIPLQSKMMSVSDIFDALTASDRPYKRAVPVDKALDILGFEVKDQHIDGELVRRSSARRGYGSRSSPARRRDSKVRVGVGSGALVLSGGCGTRRLQWASRAILNMDEGPQNRYDPKNGLRAPTAKC